MAGKWFKRSQCCVNLLKVVFPSLMCILAISLLLIIKSYIILIVVFIIYILQVQILLRNFRNLSSKMKLSTNILIWPILIQNMVSDSSADIDKIRKPEA